MPTREIGNFCMCFKDWAGVEGSLHRALASYIHRRTQQNSGARLGLICP